MPDETKKQTDPYSSYGGSVAVADPYEEYGGKSAATPSATSEGLPQRSFWDSFLKSSGLSGIVEAAKNPPQNINELLSMAAGPAKEKFAAAFGPAKHLSEIVDAHRKGDTEGVRAGVSKLASALTPSSGNAEELSLNTLEDIQRGNIKGLGGTATGLAAQAYLARGTGAYDNIFSKLSPARSIEEALGRRLATHEADVARAGGQIHPALNNTPREVLQHAADEGIKLTPGQATEDAMAQNLQKAGTTAAVGGKELAAALNENRAKFGASVNKFMDTVDQKRMGLSSESAGESIQSTAKTARSVAHDNAAQGYEKISHLMDEPVEGATISKAWNKIKGDLPVGAEDSIISVTPRSMRAVVEDLLSGKPEGFKPTVSQTIALRKFFRDLGETEGLPDKTQATYQKMENAASSALDDAAEARGNTAEWKQANAGWKDYKTKYGDPKSSLYKIIAQRDPTKIVTQLSNAPATDIQLLRAEAGDAALEPLRRQVVDDIAKSRFRIGHDGLGGYTDSYLKALFSPKQVKELYLKSDLAHRLNYDPNPSGTGSNISSLSQLGLWNQTKMSAAAKMSMPRDPLSFLPQQAAPAVRTTPFSATGGVVPGTNFTPPSTLPLVRSQAVSPITRGPLASPASLFKQSTAESAVKLAHDEMTARDLNRAIAAATDPRERARLIQQRDDLAANQ